METKRTIGYFIQVEYEDYAVYSYRESMDWLPNEGPPLETGIFGQDDPYLQMFEEDFVQTTLGTILAIRHGGMISLKIVKGHW